MNNDRQNPENNNPSTLETSRRSFMIGAFAGVSALATGSMQINDLNNIIHLANQTNPDMLLEPEFDGYGILTDRPFYSAEKNLPSGVFTGYSSSSALPTQLLVEGSGHEIRLNDSPVPGRRPRLIEVTSNQRRKNTAILINPYEKLYVWASSSDRYQLESNRVYYRTEGDKELTGLDTNPGGLFMGRTTTNLTDVSEEAWIDHSSWGDMPNYLEIEGSQTNDTIVITLDGTPVRALYDIHTFNNNPEILFDNYVFDLRNISDASRVATIIITDEPFVINDSGKNPRTVIPMPENFEGQVTITFQPTTLGTPSAGFDIYKHSDMDRMIDEHYSNNDNQHAWLISWLGNPIDSTTAKQTLNSYLRNTSNLVVGGY